MKIIIDGDGCPQKARKISEEYAAYFMIDMVVVSSIDHNMYGDFRTIIVDKGRDSADFRIIEIAEKDDIVVTQDYGLASLLIDKVYAILNPVGFRYTYENMDKLLMKRYMGQKIRRSGGRTRGPKKRKRQEDLQFEEILLKIIDAKMKD
jgi:hypothetical protein